MHWYRIMMKGVLLLACLAAAQCVWVKEMENDGAFEGDIVLDPDERENINNGNTYASIKGGRWPGAKIPYAIARSIGSTGVRAINNAIAAYHKHTCIRFRRRTNEREYIKFYKGSGCSSRVGYRPGRTNSISLASGCWRTGIVMHEVGHSIGIYHEQSRPDRDQHVEIEWNNIPKSKQFNFKKQPGSNINSLGTSYDFGSMMHYGSTAFGSGRITIRTKEPDKQGLLGNRGGFSDIDIKQINLMYCGGVLPTQRPTGGPGDCINKESDCLAWAKNGYCNDDKEAQFMKDNCCKSCKESAACPNKRARCDEWAKRGECQKNKWMTFNCRKACGLCT